jgi:predicted oxidoreductase
MVTGDTLEALAAAMNAMGNPVDVIAQNLRRDITAYDRQLERSARFVTDDQIRRVQILRQWRGEKSRTCHNQPILSAKGGPLIAVKTRLISRKSMGGFETDLHSRVLDQQGEAIPGLYAAGEAAGFGGGGLSGIRSLEGTFLSGCILTARRAGQFIGQQG